MKQLSEYKVGDRVKYIFLGDYDGTVSAIHGDSTSVLLSIELDNPAPVKFNMGNTGVIAIGPAYIEPINTRGMQE